MTTESPEGQPAAARGTVATMLPSPRLALVLLAACTGPKDAPSMTDDPLDDTADTALPPPCEVGAVPEEATRRFGWQEDGTFISPGGRLVAPAGPNVVLDGMPIDVAVHPGGAVAYVTITSADERRLLTVDLDTLTVLQTLDRADAHTGLEVSPDGAWVYAAGGTQGTVDVYAVQADGTLALDTSVAVGGTTAGLALSPDGATLWAATWSGGVVAEIDTATRAVTRTVEVSVSAWAVVYLPSRGELYVGGLAGDDVAVVDLATGEQVAAIAVPTGPAGFAASADDATVYVAVSNGDVVAAVDTASRTVVGTAAVAEDDLLDASGLPLGNSNVTSVHLADGRLYATRGGDNAVSVLDAASLERLGAFPVALYPVALAGRPDGELVVVEYKGGGIGPGPSGAKGEQKGSLTLVDVAGLDLAAETAEVSALYASPLDRFPFTCDDGLFPVPTSADAVHPIEHVVLVVKENKTLDCLFGDLGAEVPGLDADPAYQEFPAEATPNLRALIKTFGVSDNFYTDALESDSGHLYLTAAHLTHYTEWMWMDTARNGGAVAWPIQDATYPSTGNFFVHVLEHGKTLRVYGEIVGMFGEVSDGTQVIAHSDLSYPGGPAVNYAVLDEDKARYIAAQIAAEGLADFTYVSFPNDHGTGTESGLPTPESMVADNDYAVGLLVEAVSRSPDWASTAVFILQDDPQGCLDHVDASRSYLIVASPYARRGGYVSHATADYASVFAAIERMLGLPPLGRPDAVAAPPWDLFTGTADLTPYAAIPRELPAETNPAGAFGAGFSATLDFDGPDRDPRYAGLLGAYLAVKAGRISEAEGYARLAAPTLALDEERWELLEEESEEEGFAFDRDWARYEAWAVANGHPRPERPRLPTRR